MENESWYIVHVYSGFEHRVAQSIMEQAKQKNIDDIKQVFVPVQQTVEVRRGKKQTSERKFFPGYIMVRMVMNSESWHLVKDTPKVTDFLGNNGTPSPVPDHEFEVIHKQVEDGVNVSQSNISFLVGEPVRVIDGPFVSFNGKVEEVNDEREQLKVSVAIFGRETPVSLSFKQVEKV